MTGIGSVVTLSRTIHPEFGLAKVVCSIIASPKSLHTRKHGYKCKSRRLDEETSLSLINLRRNVPLATVPDLITTMTEHKLVAAGVELGPSTVYGFLHQYNMMQPLGLRRLN